MPRIGVDLGGSKIEIIAIGDDGAVLLRRRIASAFGVYEKFVAAIVGLIRDAEAAIGRDCTIGIGTPGTISRVSGRIKNSNTVCLNGRPLVADLQAQLARPIRIANDANCFALSEAIDGAAAGARSVFGVILGTGVGGGVVIESKVLDGPNGITGEWGHNPLPVPSADDLPLPACYCGRSGCIETYLCGPGMAAEHARRLPTTPDASPDAQQIVARARAGDAGCRHSLALYVDRLARALATVINVLDPEVIVLGGGLSNIDELYEQVPQRWGRYVFSDSVATRLVRNRHGDSSGVRGAAFL
jgi:fructokinase